eukprot:3286702-Amphidinium_carterae.1
MVICKFNCRYFCITVQASPKRGQTIQVWFEWAVVFNSFVPSFLYDKATIQIAYRADAFTNWQCRLSG